LLSFAIIVVFGTYNDIPARAFYIAQVCICLLVVSVVLLRRKSKICSLLLHRC